MTPEDRIAQLENTVKALSSRLETLSTSIFTNPALTDELAYNTMDRAHLRMLSFYPGTTDEVNPDADGQIVYRKQSGLNRLLMNREGVVRPVAFEGYYNTPDPTVLTIASGAITVTQAYHEVDTEGSASTDDLDTINDTNLDDNTILILRATSSSRTVVLKDGTGNLRLAGDFSLDHSRDTITLIGTGGVWYELSRSDNDT